VVHPGRFELSPPDDAIGLPIAHGKAEQQPRTRSVTPAHLDLICPTGKLRMRVMRKLPVVPICRNPTALPLHPNQRQISRCPVLTKRGASRSSRTLRRDAVDAEVSLTSDTNADDEVVWS
jgi:hypothetical protein